MFIITDKNDVIMHISETKDYQENGNILIYNKTLAIPTSLTNGVYEVSEIPIGVETQKYCYTEEKGFYANKDYAIHYTDTERISALEDIVNEIILGGLSNE